jgi:hypothetical protein
MTIKTRNHPIYTMPGEFAKRLYSRYGSDCHIPPISAWIIRDNKPCQVTITGIKSEKGCGEAADYAEISDGTTAPAFYLWPVANHCRPSFVSLRDDLGPFLQWAARLKTRCLRQWTF